MNKVDIPDFDEDPEIDTFSQLYQKQRPFFNGFKTKEEMEAHFGKRGEHNPIGTNDIVQPCGYTANVFQEFFINYKLRPDINILIDLLKDHPVYGSKEISDEIIRLLNKARVKPISDQTMETEIIHQAVQEYFLFINPKRGHVEAAYSDIAQRVYENYNKSLTVENIKTIIKRAKKSGWYVEHERDLAIAKGSSRDNG